MKFLQYILSKQSIALSLGLIVCLFSNVASCQELFLEAPDNIKTIIVKPLIPNKYDPVIQLGQKVEISFDDMEESQQEYYYEVIHCDAEWVPSNIPAAEYTNGFNTDDIRNFDNSFNTLQGYTHYWFTLPNNNVRIKTSGNYLVTVYDEDDEPVFQRKFIIYEPKVDVAISAHRDRDVRKVKENHQIQFSIYHEGMRFNNPSQEIKPVLYQNDDWSSQISDLKPQFYKQNELVYEYRNTVFAAGNEFLFFDTKNVRSATMNIASIEMGRDLYETYLYRDESRKDQVYSAFQDVNGNFVVRLLNSENNAIEADYTNVHFSLESNPNFVNKTVYVFGALSNWKLKETFKMSYDKEKELFTLNTPLKQGFYNYQYITKANDGTISKTDVDGSFFQTENDYKILVYYKKIGARYDKVIGYGKTNSSTLLN